MKGNKLNVIGIFAVWAILSLYLLSTQKNDNTAEKMMEDYELFVGEFRGKFSII